MNNRWYFFILAGFFATSANLGLKAACQAKDTYLTDYTVEIPCKNDFILGISSDIEFFAFSLKQEFNEMQNKLNMSRDDLSHLDQTEQVIMFIRTLPTHLKH
jgi:hypothetical protein